eukprot:Skav232049  [mRNA]  locus=scaffold1641:7739:8554:+ [translate_table: standard]
MDALDVKGYGILGLSNNGKQVEPPGEDTVLVDPAGLPFIQGEKGPRDAKGAAQANYKWLEIDQDESFPKEVKEAITDECKAKYHAYAGGTKKCIHVVGPDLRNPQVKNEAEAVEKLAEAYRNVFREFVEHGLTKMRLLPISGGIFSGAFKPELPEMTARAVQTALDELSEAERQHINNSRIEMCIFMESEFEEFVSAFNQHWTLYHYLHHVEDWVYWAIGGVQGSLYWVSDTVGGAWPYSIKCRGFCWEREDRKDKEKERQESLTHSLPSG